MNDALSTATIVTALVLAAWSGIVALRDRPPGRALLAAVGVLELIVLALAVTAVVALARGERPAEPETFIGYLITFVSLPPAGWVLARMEPTRWGSVTLAVALLVVPVLVLRLHQVWAGTGG